MIDAGVVGVGLDDEAGGGAEVVDLDSEVADEAVGAGRSVGVEVEAPVSDAVDGAGRRLDDLLEHGVVDGVGDTEVGLYLVEGDVAVGDRH